MCRTCGEGETSWTLQNAQRAARYHTKLLLHVLERLDLPLAHLQELRLAATRVNRRRVARLPHSGHWRSSPWGALYLSLENRCPVWKDLSDAVLNARDTDLKVDRPFTSSCMSSSEADLIHEAETHLCAALRHLSAIASALAAVRSFRESGGFHEFELGGKVDSARLCSECSDIGAVSLEFDRSFEELLDVAWPFFLRTQLTNALLEGDILQAAAWAVQFLGVAEPWGLRRVQELTSLGLELAAEHLSVRSSSITQDSGCESNAWSLLRGACAAYLTVPIIPRYETRLRRTVSRLVELGLCRTSGNAVESCSHSALTRSLDVLLKPEQQLSSSRDFDASGAALASFRDVDALYVGFRQELAKAAVEHLDSRCKLDVRKAALAGIEAISSCAVGGAMSKSRRLQLEESVSSVLEEPLFSRIAKREQRHEDSAGLIVCSSPESTGETEPLVGEIETAAAEIAVSVSSIAKQLPSESEARETEDAPIEDATIQPMSNAMESDNDVGELESIGPDVSSQPTPDTGVVETVASGDVERLVPSPVPPRPPSHFSMPSPPKEVLPSPVSSQPALDQEKVRAREPKLPMPLRPCPEMLLALQAGKILGKQLCQKAASRTVTRKILDLPLATDKVAVDDSEGSCISTTLFSTSRQVSSPSTTSEASVDETLVRSQCLEAEVVDRPEAQASFEFVPPERSCCVGGQH